MKAGYFAVAAAMAVGANAKAGHAHAHEAFHKVERNLTPVPSGTNGTEEACDCTTVWVTITGETTWAPMSTFTSTSTTSAEVKTTAPPPPPPPAPPAPTTVASTLAPTVVLSTVIVAPTPLKTVCPTPGVYTVPAVTITLTDYVSVCPPEATVTTTFAPGTYTRPEVVTTVTETDYVFYCPWTSSAPAPAPAATTPPAAPPAPAKSVPATSAVASPSAAPKSSGSTPSLGSSGGPWAITYTPYTPSGSCKSAAEVSADIAVIAGKGFLTIRLYSSDCSGLTNVGNACAANNIKIILGVFISSSGLSGAESQISDLVAFQHWSIVELVVVGNEALMNHWCTATELVAFIIKARTAFRGAGFQGPVTTTEPLNVLQENASVLCQALDIVGANIHPFFNSNTPASDAGEFVKGQLAIVDALCPGLTGINLECGWPSAGTCNGLACPGTKEQSIAIAGIKAAVGERTVMFSFQNDDWKVPGAFGCEQSWGISQLF